MLASIRRHLSWKLFLSYLVVILVGTVVLATAAQFAVPSSFDRHMAAMSQMMGGQSHMLELDFYANFREAFTETLILAAGAAFLAALVVGVLVSRRVVLPVQEMMAASQRIAEGHFDERVGVPGAVERDEQDELARLALSFNQMAERLAQMETRRIELIGNVAHELRTPLSSIKGYMEGLIDGVVPAEAAIFQQVHREADRLQRLVHDLQELSRVEAGTYELKPRPQAPGRLVDAVVARLGRQFEEKGVVLDTDVPANLPNVRADEDRVGQVLLNLVGNALQYTPPGGCVQIRVSLEGNAVRFAVVDTGVGIPRENLPHVFERFYRVDKSRSRVGGGSGIGLTIARHLVEAQGGELQAASDGLGRGSTFWFTLPVV